MGITNRKTFVKILEQVEDASKKGEHSKEVSLEQDRDYIVDYFMRIKGDVNISEGDFIRIKHLLL